MKYVKLGKSGLTVSELCFGALTVGPLQANMPPTQAAVIIAHALKRGITFFDTAQFYKTYDHLREGMRLAGKFDAVVCSKTYAFTYEGAIEAVEEARKKLDRDVVDIFMLHEQESALTLRGHRDALDALYSCKAKGIVKAVGVSTHYIAGARAATELGVDVIHPLINKNGLGIADGSREEMEAALIKASEAGIGLYAMKALGGGNLFRDAVNCLNYVRELDFINAVAIGMQSVEEVDANVEFFENGEFSEEAKHRLATKTRGLHIDEWCEGCGICAKVCPQKALQLVDGKAVCDHKKCVICGYCSGHCPAWAIKVV